MNDFSPIRRATASWSSILSLCIALVSSGCGRTDNPEASARTNEPPGLVTDRPERTHNGSPEVVGELALDPTAEIVADWKDNPIEEATNEFPSSPLVGRDYLTEHNEIDRVTRFLGKIVRNEAGEELGVIEDIALETRSGRILNVALSTRNKWLAIPWAAVQIDTETGALTMAADRSQIEGAAGIEPDAWPTGPRAAWGAPTEAAPRSAETMAAGEARIRRALLMDEVLGQIDEFRVDIQDDKLVIHGMVESHQEQIEVQKRLNELLNPDYIETRIVSGVASK